MSGRILTGLVVIIGLMGGLLWLYFTAESEYQAHKQYQFENIANSGEITCASFKTQNEAQQFFDGQKDKSLYGIDGDQDGKVCETLP